MFYYLLFNSSFSFIVDSPLFSTILYGSILYIFTHAILNYCNIEILTIINNYYWYIFILDIISLSYCIYLISSPINNTNNSNNSNNPNNLEVSFNLLNNKIRSIFKKPLTISDSSYNPTCNQSSNPTCNPSSNLSSNPSQIPLQEKKQKSTTNMSTPLSLLRTIETPPPQTSEHNYTTQSKNGCNEGYADSNTGSDLGSIMDLDDFEKSL